MGSYSHLTVDDYPIFNNKNSYYPELVNMIFTEADFIIEKRKKSTLNTMIWGESYLNSKGHYTFKGYRQSVKVCRERLEIYGASMIKGRKDFQNAKKYAKEFGEYLFDFPIGKVSFKEYINTISEILKKKEPVNDWSLMNLRESLRTIGLFIEGQSIKDGLYCILTLLSDDGIVEYDLTEVISGGWVKEKAVHEISIEKIIVLTEGKTDVEFIKLGLEKLYPHLAPYYHFINFDEYKVESNASALVKLVMSLAAANIKHPIIVLFDNDTTGIMEMTKLGKIKLPNNFRILKLPDLKSKKNYPTIGPTGIKKMNINGLACGIEMYFGDDALLKDNNLIPIQWKGYNDLVKKYQGEISLKNHVQEKFREKLKLNSSGDFSDFDILLTQMFTSFKNTN